MTLPSSPPISLLQILAESQATSLVNARDKVFGAGNGPASMYRFAGWSPGFAFSLVLTQNLGNFDLRTWLLQYGGWNGVLPVTGVLTINPGVWISDATGAGALRIVGLPTSSSIDLVVYGNIAGKGGKGGNGSSSQAIGGTVGGPGSTALVLGNRVRLWDKPGSGILGGGGGGGGGGGARTWFGSLPGYDGGGGGGGGGISGYPYTSLAGSGGVAENSPGIVIGQNGGDGGPGNHLNGGTFGGGGWPGIIGGHGGGGGGAWGKPGLNGGTGNGNLIASPGFTGGPGGWAIDGWSFVQHIEHSGSIAGALVN